MLHACSALGQGIQMVHHSLHCASAIESLEDT